MTESNKKCCLVFSKIIKPSKEGLLYAEKKGDTELFDQLFNFQKILLYWWRNENINDIINCSDCSYIIGEFTTVLGRYDFYPKNLKAEKNRYVR